MASHLGAASGAESVQGAELLGKVALVTGASAGIGRQVALTLAQAGARVAVAARRRDLLEEVAVEIAARTGSGALVLAEDVTKEEAPCRLQRTVREHWGGVDIVVQSAGGSRPLAIEATEAEWQEAMTLNFTAIRRLAHACLPGMIEAGWGRIISITGSLEPKSLNAANSAKAAVHAWAKGLSLEVARFGITVNSVSPGRIMSEQISTRMFPTEKDRTEFASAHIPVGYFGEPIDVAELVRFLASPQARYITGEIIHVDGGMRRSAF